MSDTTEVSTEGASGLKPTVRCSSTSCTLPTSATVSPILSNGMGGAAAEAPVKQPSALRQRSASTGKCSEIDTSKRMRDTNPQSDGALTVIITPVTEIKEEISETQVSIAPSSSNEVGPLAKRRKSSKSESGLGNDIFCWVCHKELVAGHQFNNCKTCPRAYHSKCVPNADVSVSDIPAQTGEHWACPECRSIDYAENVLYRSQAMQLLTLDQFCTLLKFSLGRMKAVVGAEPFLKPVDPVEFPKYIEYVVYPMDLSQLERNVRRKQYGSTEAFLADTKWILHNSIIFNTSQAKLTSSARSILKACRQEMAEIENCPDCYLNAHTRKESWFIEVCRRPHMLVWAKLKGFPFWPAKAMKVNKESAVDVRFFGAHDRAWVPVRDCFLYSREMPALVKQKKRNNLENCIEEVEQHAVRLKERFGAFAHAPLRTPFDPEQQEKQLKILLPNYRPGVDGKRARTILYPEISAISRVTPSKAATQSTNLAATSTSTRDAPPTADKNQERVEKHAYSFVTTTTRSGRLSTTPRGKFYMSSIVLTKKDIADQQIFEPKVEDSNDGEAAEDVSEKSPSDEVYESNASQDASVHVEDTHVKLEEVEAISAIIEASKAMEETLGHMGQAERDSDESISDVDDPIGESVEEQNILHFRREPESDVAETDVRETVTASSSANVSSTYPDSNDGDNYCPGDGEESSALWKNNANNDAIDTIMNTEISDSTDKNFKDIHDSVLEEMGTNKEIDGKTAKARTESLSEMSFTSGNTEPPATNIDEQNVTAKGKTNVTIESQVRASGNIEESDLFAPKVSIKLLKSSSEDNKSHESTNILSMHKTHEQLEITTSRDKTRSVPALISADKRLDPSPCEVQITPIPKLKRKLTSTAAATNKIPSISNDSSGTSDISSDSESEQKNAASAKKKKTLLETPREVIQQSDSEELLDGDDVNSPRPSNTEDDTVFPSLFLDPSVTITVIENSPDKKYVPSSTEAAAKELCASVSLSSDVSLTIIEKSKDKRPETVSPPSSVSSTGESSQKQIQSLQGNSKARKSMPQTKPQMIAVKNKSSLMANSGTTLPLEMPHAAPTIQKELHSTSVPVCRPSNLIHGAPGMQYLPPHPDHRQDHRPFHPPGHVPLPQLHPRPFTGHLSVGPPPEAGPVTAELHKSAAKLTEYVRQSLEALMKDLSAFGSPQATIVALQLEIERLQWRHQQELAELKHNADLVLLEMRASMDSERARALSELRRQAEIEKHRAIEETKKKQWCAYCNKEALFYCCWNTSYCDYPCQQAHWPRHMATCTQKYSKDGSNSSTSPVPNASKPGYHNTAKVLLPNVPLTQQHLVGLNTSSVMPTGRPPQHFSIIPRPMQGGEGMPQFATYPAGGSPRPPLGSQTPNVAFPMQPHFFM